jgi:hypothetical protein
MHNDAGQPAQPAFLEVQSAIRASQIVTPELAADALADIRTGVITGEGPTAAGRIHFSRTLDRQDAAFVAEVLAAPRDGAVTRAEAQRLLEIDAAASERSDGGRFDDLLSKAIAHHALAQAGKPVPPRQIALSADTPLESWAGPQGEVDAEVLRWITGEMRARKRTSRGLMSIAILFGVAAAPVAHSLAGLIDFAA